MSEKLVLTADSHILDRLQFKPYRNAVERHAVQYNPASHEPETRQIKTPWGEMLTLKKGDYLVNELSAPDDQWPVEREIFEKSYVQTRPYHYAKRALTYLASLEDAAQNPDQVVAVHTLEGVVTVRAGDFYLARGINGEIWPYPKEKVQATLREVTSAV